MIDVLPSRPIVVDPSLLESLKRVKACVDYPICWWSASAILNGIRLTSGLSADSLDFMEGGDFVGFMLAASSGRLVYTDGVWGVRPHREFGSIDEVSYAAGRLTQLLGRLHPLLADRMVVDASWSDNACPFVVNTDGGVAKLSVRGLLNGLLGGWRLVYVCDDSDGSFVRVDAVRDDRHDVLSRQVWLDRSGVASVRWVNNPSVGAVVNALVCQLSGPHAIDYLWSLVCNQSSLRRKPTLDQVQKALFVLVRRKVLSVRGEGRIFELTKPN